MVSYSFATAHVRQIPEVMTNYDIPLFLKLIGQCSISEQCLLTECSVAMTTVLTMTCSSYTNMYQAVLTWCKANSVPGSVHMLTHKKNKQNKFNINKGYWLCNAQFC